MKYEHPGDGLEEGEKEGDYPHVEASRRKHQCMNGAFLATSHWLTAGITLHSCTDASSNRQSLSHVSLSLSLSFSLVSLSLSLSLCVTSAAARRAELVPMMTMSGERVQVNVCLRLR